VYIYKITYLNMFSIFKCNKTNNKNKNNESSENVDDPDCIPSSSKNLIVVSTNWSYNIM